MLYLFVWVMMGLLLNSWIGVFSLDALVNKWIRAIEPFSLVCAIEDHVIGACLTWLWGCTLILFIVGLFEFRTWNLLAGNNDLVQTCHIANYNSMFYHLYQLECVCVCVCLNWRTPKPLLSPMSYWSLLPLTFVSNHSSPLAP